MRMHAVPSPLADEYERLNYLLPICSMPSDRPTQQCSCFMLSSLPQGNTRVLFLLLQVLPSLCPPAPSALSTKSCSPSLDRINFLRQSVRFSIIFIQAVTRHRPHTHPKKWANPRFIASGQPLFNSCLEKYHSLPLIES